MHMFQSEECCAANMREPIDALGQIPWVNLGA